MSLSDLLSAVFLRRAETYHWLFIRNYVRDTFLVGDERKNPDLLKKADNLARTLEYKPREGRWIETGDVGLATGAVLDAKFEFKKAQAGIAKLDPDKLKETDFPKFDLRKLRKIYTEEKAKSYTALAKDSGFYCHPRTFELQPRAKCLQRPIDTDNPLAASSPKARLPLSPEVASFVEFLLATFQSHEAVWITADPDLPDRLITEAKRIQGTLESAIEAIKSVPGTGFEVIETTTAIEEAEVEKVEASETSPHEALRIAIAEIIDPKWTPFDLLEDSQHLDRLLNFFKTDKTCRAYEAATGAKFKENLKWIVELRDSTFLRFEEALKKAQAEGLDPQAEVPSVSFIRISAVALSAPFAYSLTCFFIDVFTQYDEGLVQKFPSNVEIITMAEDPTKVDLHQDLFQTMQQTARRGEGGEFYTRRNNWTIEERIVISTLMLFESHFSGSPPIGPKSMKKSTEMIQDSLNRSLTKPEVRETFAKNVDIWMRLQRTFEAALPTLSRRSLREAYADSVGNNVDIPESSTLIAENHATLTMDLTLLNTLLIIARNMLALKEVAQDICATVQFDKQVLKLIVLCVGVTSKGYDGENVGADMREKLNDVTELYKKLLVTCLQFTHNLTMGNDRQKTAFWIDMLFDNDFHNDNIHELPRDELKVEVVYEEARNWLRRNPTKSPLAASILAKYAADVPLSNTAGPLPEDEFSDSSLNLATLAITDSQAQPNADSPQTVVWSESATTKEEQDRMYARVSHEIDVWWKLARDKNYDGWNTEMETVEHAQARAQACKDNAMNRYVPRTEQEAEHEYEPEGYEGENIDDGARREHDERSFQGDEREDEVEEEEDEEDDESYVEGPLRGLLTEVPNILDTKQIEALHMTVKACIVDSMGSGLTPAGENLQKTRCKMFLALDCGKNLLREMLVFIAVWEQNEDQFIFQISAQIIESFHHNALIPYAWKSLRILKDIVSPAQTVLLRLINYMFRARKDTTIYQDQKDYLRDAKLIFYLFEYFRTRVVPDCIGLIYAQAQIRNNHADPEQFPVDLWDMERAKDGLMQYLDFLAVIAEIPQMKPLLIKWEAVYELIALLNILEAGVERKGLVDSVDAANLRANRTTPNVNPQVERPYDPNPQEQVPSTSTLPLLHDTPHKFPWSGIKVQILVVLTTLVAPLENRRSPGNPEVQKQILKYDGIMPLLNCCNYDGHNEYLKERTTLALKWVMEGCAEAQQYLRGLQPLKDQSGAAEVNGGVANVAARQAANIRRDQEDEPVPGHVVESVD